MDIFLAIEERLGEEQDNEDYANWRDNLSCIQSATIVSKAFSKVIDELKAFVSLSIQNIHYKEMELAFNYDAKILDQSYINHEQSQDWTFANDFIENQEIRQITFKRLLENCVQSYIKSIWGVNYLTSVGINHLVILLNNGTYRCSCLSLVNCGIVCRHYFSVMLRTSQAQFHIGFINSRWFTTIQSNLKNQSFYPASKFDGDLVIPFLETDFLTDNNSSSIPNSNEQQYVSISKQRLYYSNVQGLIKQANQIACKSCDESFIELLQTYIADKNHEAFELEQSRRDINSQSQTRIHLNLTVDDNQIKNPLIRRPKGRPAGTARFKGPLEASTKSNIVGSKTQNKCSLCNNVGHNRATCPSNPDRKKRKI
ncbi:unnamed protein product [Rhizophagus irregularis]|nr:unnamed protein product [Rhizophagus irregularis]